VLWINGANVDGVTQQAEVLRQAAWIHASRSTRNIPGGGDWESIGRVRSGVLQQRDGWGGRLCMSYVYALPSENYLLALLSCPPFCDPNFITSLGGKSKLALLLGQLQIWRALSPGHRSLCGIRTIRGRRWWLSGRGYLVRT
jgi:hypothetical protein